MIGKVVYALDWLSRQDADPIDLLPAMNNGRTVLAVVRWYIDSAASELGIAAWEHVATPQGPRRVTVSPLEKPEARALRHQIVRRAHERATRDAKIPVPAHEAASCVRVTCWRSDARGIKASHWRAIRTSRRAA